MKPTLVLHPIHNSSADMLRCFAEGKPLSSDQQRFLAWHEHELSSETLDPLIKYYIESEKRRKYHGNFLLPHEKLNEEDIKKLKERIRATLKDKYNHVAFEMTEKQFLDFKKYAASELIFLAGNEFISGARFYVGGVIPAIYFQWAEFFGVWKYAMIHANQQLQAKKIIYFEQIRNRTLQQCIDEYKKHLQEDILFQKKIVDKKIQEPSAKIIQTPRLVDCYHLDYLWKFQ